MTETLFTPTAEVTEPPKEFHKELVGEGKKFKTDEDLARGKWEADNHIKTLEAELASARKTSATEARLQELVDKLTAAGIPQPKSGPEPKGDERPTGVAPEQLEAVVGKKLQEYETERTARDNRAIVRNELQKHLGPNFVTKLKERAAELEVGEKFLDSLAASNPKAFLKLVGVNDTQAQTETLFTPPRSAITSSTEHRESGKKDFKYYQGLKAKDQKAWTPQVQQEMHEQAMKLGAEFYA